LREHDVESNLIKLWFGKLLDALRIKSAPPRMSSVDPASLRKKEPFSVVVDRLTIRGTLFFPAAQPAQLYPAVVICHGIPGSAAPRPADDSGYEDLAERISSEGMIALISAH